MPRSVYGDLNWYLQSRAATTVRPRPLQQQQQRQLQPSASVRSAVVPSHHYSPSAFTSSSPQSSLREANAREAGKAPFAFPVARRSGSQKADAAAISEASEASIAQVQQIKQLPVQTIACMHVPLQTNSVLRQNIEDGSVKREPLAASADVAEVVASSTSQLVETLQVALPAVEIGLAAQSSDIGLFPRSSDAVVSPEVTAVIAPAAELCQAKNDDLQYQAQASAIATAAAPVIALDASSVSGADVLAAEAAVELQDGETNPVLKTLQQLQVACS
jgi:hypothetical protein